MIAPHFYLIIFLCTVAFFGSAITCGLLCKPEQFEKRNRDADGNVKWTKAQDFMLDISAMSIILGVATSLLTILELISK